MADYSIYVSLVAKALEDDDVLRNMVDGKIIPGFRRAQADDFLSGINHACIGVRDVDFLDDPLPGSDYHGLSLYEALIEFHVIHLAQDGTYIAGIIHEIMRIMKRPINKTLNNISYSVNKYGKLRFFPVNDDQFNDRVQSTGTCTLKFIDK